MAHAAFALKNSGLEPFLLAEVGTEANGSALTVLSMLARLDQDPWAQAAVWTNLPRSVATERIAECIARTPVDAPPATAARIVGLLPGHAPAAPRVARETDLAPMPGWRPMLLFCAFLALGVALNVVLAPRPSPAHPPATEKPVAHAAP